MKNTSLKAKTGFNILLGCVGYSVVSTLLQLAIGPIALMKSAPIVFLVGVAQVTGLAFTLGWSKELKVQTPLLVAMVGLGGASIGAAVGQVSMAGLAALVGIIAFLTWLHKVYKALDRHDLMKSENILASTLLLIIFGATLLPPVVRGLVLLGGTIGLWSYFGYAFYALRGECEE